MGTGTNRGFIVFWV